MARSTYIYVVTHDNWEGPLAAFTVRRELVNYVRRHPSEAPSDIHFWRVADGQARGRTEIADQIKELAGIE